LLKDGRQFINIDQEIRQKPDVNQYISGGQIMGLLMEGDFPSVFAGRSVPTDSFAPQPSLEPFLPATMDGRNPMVVLISDGEFAVGENAGGRLMRLPEENKQLMTNLIDIMTGQELLTKLRVREFNDRMLDRDKLVGQEDWIRIVNLGLPLLAIVLFGVGRGFLRRRKNQKLQKDQ
jgi:ABC-2 type transport system permease protein